MESVPSNSYVTSAHKTIMELTPFNSCIITDHKIKLSRRLILKEQGLYSYATTVSSEIEATKYANN